MKILFMLLLIVAVVLFAVAIVTPANTRLSLIAGGLLAATLVPLIQTIDAVAK